MNNYFGGFLRDIWRVNHVFLLYTIIIKLVYLQLVRRTS
uniref:Uncharacterized protein n=1 Tax=Siphoviridae sp. ctJhT5 TaxID=2826242 RepID=A0A8S5QZC5_9CAUD|nr:MAG TPA: hypothetical protein [Siphoviridae sp. ctJhT5]DAJ02392.1 MAG TPA: hypothetical protein [Caudoviricetes sp.]